MMIVVYFFIGVVSLALALGIVLLIGYYAGYIVLFLCGIMLMIFPFALGYIVFKVIHAVIETWGNK